MSGLATEKNVTGNRPPRISIQGLRRLILVVLTVSVFSFTAGVFALVQRLFDNFGPAVQKDLDWKTLRGAQELARATDLGLMLSDASIVTQAFGDYRKVDDVVAIVAMNNNGQAVATHGTPPETSAQLFSGPPASIRRTAGHLVAWAPALVEGSPVGKVALVISTRRLIESQMQLRRISYGTAGAGALALVLGILFVNFFTRSITQRDVQLAEYATGLEKKVAERTAQLDQRNRGMRLVLDHVGQGFITIGIDGVMSPERSSIVDRWFGIPEEGMTLANYLRPLDARAADWITMGLSSFADDMLPRDLLLDQMPKRMSRGDRTMSLTYTPILASDGNNLERLLVVITDITDEIARETMERDTREMSQIFQRASSDRAGTEQFFAESNDLVRQITSGTLDSLVEKRSVHTLKGNCSLFGIESMSLLCHQLESRLVEEGGGLTPAERSHINDRWTHVSRLVQAMLGERKSRIELEEVDLEELVKALQSRAPHESILAITETWRHEPVSLRFARFADRAVYMAKRLGKPAVTVHTETCGVRLDPSRWAPFWTAFVHAVNNAVDHGIEDPQARLALGKSEAGNLWLSATRQGESLVISLRDDGCGIDWQRLRAKAVEHGMRHASESDLAEVMFADGISTREEVTQTSGRGVGLAALRQATLALEGRIQVRSEAGRGTEFEFRFGSAGPVA